MNFMKMVNERGLHTSEDRPFRDLLENQCYNQIYEAANKFVQDNLSSLDCSTRYVRSPDEATFSDIYIRLASIEDFFRY